MTDRLRGHELRIVQGEESDRLPTVRYWFGDAQAGSLELPDGWFGSPQDTHHRLTFSAETANRLILELDHAILLTFTDVGDVGAVPEALVLREFASLVVDCRGFLGQRPVVRLYDAGAVIIRASQPRTPWSPVPSYGRFKPPSRSHW